jgi:hypothetical protein
MDIQKEFNPVISKIKLNPEQAVLACTCVLGRYVRTANRTTSASLCTRRVAGTSRNNRSTSYCAQAAAANFT